MGPSYYHIRLQIHSGKPRSRSRLLFLALSYQKKMDPYLCLSSICSPLSQRNDLDDCCCFSSWAFAVLDSKIKSYQIALIFLYLL